MIVIAKWVWGQMWIKFLDIRLSVKGKLGETSTGKLTRPEMESGSAEIKG